MNSNLVTIGLVQMSMSPEPAENIRRAEQKIAEARGRGAQIVCLPELFTSPYFCTEEKADRDYSENLSAAGAIVAQLSHAARKSQVVLVAGSIYERAGERRFNTATVFDQGGNLLGSYRKIHIPHDPGFYEENYFKSGDLGFPVFDTTFGRIAVLICFDQWFPEAARAVALSGAEIVFYPTSIGNVDYVPQREGNWQDAWETVQRGHAIANNVVVAPVNRVGREGATTFWGGSFVCDAFGKVLTRGGDQDEIVIATIDRAHAREVREAWGFFRARRVKNYELLTS